MAFSTASLTAMRALSTRGAFNDVGTTSLSAPVPSKRAFCGPRPQKLYVAANDADGRQAQASQPSTSQAPPAPERTPDHLRVPIIQEAAPSRSFEELMGFAGAPERINGRLAMAAFALAYVNENLSHENIFLQFGDDPGAALGLIAAISLATLAPQFAPWGSKDWNPDNDYGDFYGNSKLIQGRTVVFTAIFAGALEKLTGKVKEMDLDKKLIESKLATPASLEKAQEMFQVLLKERLGYRREDWITPSTVEMWNGRAAMLGFVCMFLYEGCWGYPLF